MKKIITALCLILFIVGCSSTKKIPAKLASKNNNVQQSSDLKNQLQNGVDFFAQGNQPSNWTLSINYDDTVRFTADDGLALKFAYNQLKKDVNEERRIFTVTLKSGNVKIEIKEKICTVTTIREVFKKEVTVVFNKTMYSGCGKFLADNNLEARWLLEKIGNTAIVPGEYNKVPEFNINIVEGTVSGNDGCNSIRGKMEVQGKRIQFYRLLNTKMGCNKKSIEKIISAQINEKIISYYFKDGKLFLYLPDDSLLVFKKV